MWYILWILGLGAAILLAIASALQMERHEKE